MSLRAFCSPGQAKVGELIELNNDESHYLLKVRRVRPDQDVELMDGEGSRWSASFCESKGSRALLHVDTQLDPPSPHRPIRIFIGTPDRNAAQDAVIAACAMGADEIVLIDCERSQRFPPNFEKLNRHIRESMRQCGRPKAPALLGPFDFPGHLDFDHRLAFFAWEGFASSFRGKKNEERSFDIDSKNDEGARDLIPSVDPSAPLQLFVGPEGGFSDGEVETLLEAAFVPLSLGPWVLRTELAVVAILARFTAR